MATAGAAHSVIDFATLISTTNCHQKTSYTNLKGKQMETLEACSLGDVMCVLPTGYGKTVVIQMLPFLRPGEQGSVIVVTPLNAILEEQRQRFGTACVVIDDKVLQDLQDGIPGESSDRLRKGQFQYLLGHPEKVTNPVLLQTLMKEEVSQMITHIVIDEAHCMLSWGKSDFRPAFMKLSTLRSSLPTAKMLALTATASRAAVAEIQEALHMRQPALVKASPDRPTVYIEVRRRPASTGGDHTVDVSYEYCIDPILDELREKEVSFPRTIMYLPLRWCGYSHARAIGYLKKSASFQALQAEGDEEVKSFIAQYHAPQTSEMRTLITSSMQKPDGPLRLLLATEAYGMGADSPNVRRVVHVGPPSNLETYIQEIGRCGRDGLPADAILYFNNTDIASNKEHMTDSMRDFCNLTTCRREFLMAYFGGEIDCAEKDRCCDVCSGTPPQNPKPVKPLKPDSRISLTLQYYFDAENSLVTQSCLPHLSTGLGVQLADIISSQPAMYLDDNCLEESFPFLQPSYIANIKIILNSLLVQ